MDGADESETGSANFWSGPAKAGPAVSFGRLAQSLSARDAPVVEVGSPFSDGTMILELLLDIRSMTARILGILEEDDEEEDPEEDT